MHTENNVNYRMGLPQKTGSSYQEQMVDGLGYASCPTPACTNYFCSSSMIHFSSFLLMELDKAMLYTHIILVRLSQTLAHLIYNNIKPTYEKRGYMTNNTTKKGQEGERIMQDSKTCPISHFSFPSVFHPNPKS